MLPPWTIAEHAARAGWRGTDLVIAVAVAMGESGGNEQRAGGLWSVAGDPGGDPAGNARAAFARWKQSGWSTFKAHNDKRYLLFMPGAAVAISSAGVVEAIKDPAGAAKAVARDLPGADMLDAAQNALTLGYKSAGWLGNRNNWSRIAYVMLGTGLVWGGLLMVVGRPVMSTTGAVVGSVLGTRTAGKAVKTVKAAKAGATT